MSITDELREWVTDHYSGWKSKQAEGIAIADRIDAEHESACAEAYGNGVMSVPIAMDESAWVELPKDADGEYIHVGDVLDSRVDYLFDGKPFTVRALVLCEDGWEVADGRFGNRYEPDSLRHHHAPTVEDVLREFADEVYADADNEIRDRDFLCAKYAKRLTLAEGEDA